MPSFGKRRHGIREKNETLSLPANKRPAATQITPTSI
jgi:hypothetical protein